MTENRKADACYERIGLKAKRWVLIAALLTGSSACNPMGEDIFSACQVGHVKTVEHLLHKNQSLLQARDSYGLTPLHAAAFGGHVETVELLLKMGADVNATDNGHGLTPLYMAAQNAQVRIVPLLIAKGAKVDARLDSGDTPLHVAAQGYRFSTGERNWAVKEMVEIAKILVAAGADVNGRTNGGTTPLHYASRYGNKAMVELLLSMGANVNAEDNGGSLPLHYLADSTGEEVPGAGLVETAKVLLANGARVSQKGQFGSTPLEDATKTGKNDLATLLRQNAGHPDH